MISIRECVSDLQAVRDEHVKFVGRRVETVINFYIDVFCLLEDVERNKRLPLTTFRKKIKQIKDKHQLDDYKRLLQALLKKGKITNAENVSLIKYSKNRLAAANDITRVLVLLRGLLYHYKKILEIDFEVNYSAILAEYQGICTKYKKIWFLMATIFDYENWFLSLDLKTAWGPYQLTRRLNLNTCPYCNRQYTFTISKVGGEKVARPQLDHFLPKKQHPLLAVSFFNLIPSCSVCNASVKGATPTSYDTHLNPYSTNNKHELFSFSYTPLTYEASIGESQDLIIEIEYAGNPYDLLSKTRVEGNIKMFYLKEIYTGHTDTVREIIRKKEVSNDKYIEMLQGTFRGFPISKDEAYRLAFGNYFEQVDFHNRPLAKLTKDIASKVLVKLPKKSP